MSNTLLLENAQVIVPVTAEGVTALTEDTQTEIVAVLRDYILTSELKSAAETKLEKDLKPKVKAIRKALGENKETFVSGTFRNKRGNFKINFVEVPEKLTADVEVAKKFLAAGILTHPQYEELVKNSPYSYNLVSFKATL